MFGEFALIQQDKVKILKGQKEKKKKRKMRSSNTGITMAENVPALKRQAPSSYKQSSIETHIQAYSTEMAEYRVKRKV